MRADEGRRGSGHRNENWWREGEGRVRDKSGIIW